MTNEEAKGLKTGDTVFWKDPDEGAASRAYKIKTIEVYDDEAIIEEPDGSVLQCFVAELNRE